MFNLPVHTQDLESYIASLDKDELEELYAVLEEYEQDPVSIEEFITDPEFLGNFFSAGCRQFWLDVLKKIYPSPLGSPYFLIILRGAIGLGKSTTACVGMAYDIYRLLCLKVPQRVLGVLETTKLVFFIANATLNLASDVVWDKLSQIFKSSPFFSKVMAKVPGVKRDTLFPKRIDIAIGSRVTHSVGQDIFSCIIDEANLEIVKGQVYETFKSLLRRMQSRYMSKGSIPGRMWIISSEGDKAALLTRLASKYKGKKGVLEVGAALWEVVPERYSGKTFKVYIGSETRPPEIIDERNKDLLEKEPELIIDVPVEHYDDFTLDIGASLRELAGVPTVGSYKLFKLKHKLAKVITVSNIFPDEIEVDFDDDQDLIQNYLKIPEYFKNPIQKEIPRCIHIDIGLSGDRLGIAASFVSGFKERTIRDPYTFQETTEAVPTVITEWCLGIRAKPGQQIPLYKIRLFLQWLTALGYPIDVVSCDGFQSADMIQWAKKAGYNAELVSVDKTNLPYLQLRSAIYEELQVIPCNNILKKELEELELSPDGKKVDHPEEFSDGTPGSKDIADAVCGSSYVARDRAENYKLLFMYKPASSMSGDLKEFFWG